MITINVDATHGDTSLFLLYLFFPHSIQHLSPYKNVLINLARARKTTVIVARYSMAKTTVIVARYLMAKSTVIVARYSMRKVIEPVQCACERARFPKKSC